MKVALSLSQTWLDVSDVLNWYRGCHVSHSLDHGWPDNLTLMASATGSVCKLLLSTGFYGLVPQNLMITLFAVSLVARLVWGMPKTR